ncbi:hypothetical protein JCM16303_005275, partial [Sporobolomyces ruberrimus]
SDPIPLDAVHWVGEFDLALVAFPSRFHKHTGRSAVAGADWGGEFYRDEQTLVDISFQLPPDADRRFVRFVRFFELEVVKSSIDKILPIRDGGTAREGSYRSNAKNSKKAIRGVVDEETSEVKPGWLLWTVCSEC